MNRIKELRIQNNWTQAELAKKLNQTKSNVSKYETGSLDPNTQVLIKLAEIFNVSADYLLGKTDDPTPYKTFAEYNRAGLERIYKSYGIEKKNNWISFLGSDGDSMAYEIPEENMETVKVLLDKLAKRQK